MNGSSFDLRRSSDWDTTCVSMDSAILPDLTSTILQHNNVQPRVMDEEQVGRNDSHGAVHHL
eukprot:997295-Amphidinium_carterae.1